MQGKALSYNNLNDADAALELVSEFLDGPPTVVIVKHANPCGVASGDTLLEAYQAAFACDTVSAFGGIIACNRPSTPRRRKRSRASSPKWWWPRTLRRKRVRSSLRRRICACCCRVSFPTRRVPA
ncbi:hypothetical protein GCM10020258_19510 [Sphingomonas yabuuchiae]